MNRSGFVQQVRRANRRIALSVFVLSQSRRWLALALDNEYTTSWRLRPFFLGCMAIGCISVVVLWPFVQEKAIYIPFGVLAATFILPDLIFPNRVSLEIDETGVTYFDFSQQIHTPWAYITGYEYKPEMKRVDVYVNFPRANFSVRTTHPHFERLKGKLRNMPHRLSNRNHCSQQRDRAC